MTICERMFDLMYEKHVSAYTLCKELGIYSGVASGWKRRNCDPPAKYLPTIARLCGVSIDYLCTGEDYTPQKEATQDEKEIPNLNADEERLLKKYRELDEDGKDIVKSALVVESRRINTDAAKKETA
ncbi:MAG: hypothetical protein IJW67_11650 [Blautia sp.]|nr:hypothetical protein [Blautia sp.]